MNYSSAGGSSVHATVNLIMAAKPLNVIAGQPTTATMDKMTEQMAQMVAPIKTTAWGGLHGSLALVLDNADYEIVTKAVVKNTTPPTGLSKSQYYGQHESTRPPHPPSRDEEAPEGV